MKGKRISVALAVMSIVLLFSGCGGGGGGDSSPTPTAPAAPTGVTATAGDNSASISWSAVAGATSYNIYYSTTAGVTKANGTKITGATSPRIVTGLTNGTPYYFVVTAVNAIGESADSSQVSATPALAPPAAPTGVSATAGDNSATIGWSVVAGATSYNIYYSPTSPVTKVTGNKLTGRVSPSIVTGLTNGTPYYFVVTAVNAAGESVESTQVTATPTPAPLPPAPTNVTAAAGPNQATINWNPVTDATSYNIYWSTTSPVTKASPTKLTGVTTIPRIVTGLINFTKYYFVVTAVSANGESSVSNEAEATPTPATPPTAPSNVSAVPGPGQATISWDNVTDATSYNVYYSATFGVTKATGTKVALVTSPKVISGLIRGTTYYFVTTAVNAIGESVESSQASAMPNPPNPTYAPGDLTGTWNVRAILSGSSPGWYGVTADVDSSGNVSTSAPVGTTTATFGLLSITSGTGVSAGVVTDNTGNETFYGKMSTSKNLIVGTSTQPDGTTFALHVFVKRVPGVTFSSTDLANTTIAYQRVYSGNSHFWEKGNGSINGSGQMSFTSVQDSNGSASPPAATAISVNGTTGIVSIAAESSQPFPFFSGVMSPDKKVIVGSSTDASGTYSLRVIQMRGQTYTQPDLAGINAAFALHSDPVSSWAHATWSTDLSGDVTVLNILNSDGTSSPPPPFTHIIDAKGDIGTEGMLSYGKDLAVFITDNLDGSSMVIKVQ